MLLMDIQFDTQPDGGAYENDSANWWSHPGVAWIFRESIFRFREFDAFGKTNDWFLYSRWEVRYIPRPLRPTNRRSLNFATWFFMTAVQFRNSAHQFSSLPAFIVTIVPSPTSASVTTLNATGSVLFDLQWFGSDEHKIYGLPVRTAKWQRKT